MCNEKLISINTKRRHFATVICQEAFYAAALKNDSQQTHRKTLRLFTSLRNFKISKTWIKKPKRIYKNPRLSKETTNNAYHYEKR